MRGVGFLLLLCLLASSAAMAASPTTVPVTIRSGEMENAGATLRLVAMPDGMSAAAVRVVAAGGAAPLEAYALAPMIMRGQRFLPVVVSPQGEPDGGADARRIHDVRLEVDFAPDKALPSTNDRARAYSRGFHEGFGAIVPDGAKELGANREGSYLIITAPQFLSVVEPLAQWKREKGFEVHLATTAETGTDRDQIRAYIGELYRTAPVPPQFVLLVGDVQYVPAWDFHHVVTDLQYALQEGEDFLPDLCVGRISVNDIAQAETVVAKTIGYESNPYRGDPGAGEWMGRALVVGADYPSTTPVPTSSWVRQQLLQCGWTAVDSVFYPPDWVGTPLIKRSLNKGASLVTYRGWARDIDGWEPPRFIRADIPGLANQWMLPVVMSFVCANNRFDDPNEDCFGEVWLRAGSSSSPTGAVAFLGNGEHWSHTRFNDAAAISVASAIRQAGLRRLGELLNALRLDFLRQFPLEIPYQSEAGESVEFYFYIYNLLGDPELSIWSGPAIDVDVEVAGEVPAQGNFLRVVVRRSGDANPVAGARVGLTQGEELLGCAWTDAAGEVVVPLAGLTGPDPVRVTVTGANVFPQRIDVPVGASQPLEIASIAVIDDGTEETRGNGDGVPNPGERIGLRFGLVNATQEDLPAHAAALFPDAAQQGAAFPPGEIEVPALGPRGSAVLESPFLYEVPVNAGDGYAPRFYLRISREGAPAQVSETTVSVAAPSILHVGHDLGGLPLDPGAAVEVACELRNEGSLAANAVSAVLRSLDPGVAAVEDSSTAYGTIPPGGSAYGEEAFVVRAAAGAVAGQSAGFKLILTTEEGYVSETTFALPIGTVDHTAPLGPDRHGYWAYDNTDTDYPAGAPLYEWVEISAAYGGGGARLTMDPNPNDTTDPNTSITLPLPFPFRFYGQEHDSVRVSDNGWISFDLSDLYDFYNWSLPTQYGNLSKVAAFWDNLYSDKKDAAEVIVTDGVYYWSDPDNHRFIIEWSRVGNVDQPGAQGEPSLDFNDLQTFQIILLDPAHYPTASGDGIIKVQYKQIANVDTGRMYATVGILNADGTDAIEYSYSNLYPEAAAPLSSGLAVQYTTEQPAYIPFGLASFRARGTDSGVGLSWEPVDGRPRANYRVYRAAEGSADYRLVPGASLDPSSRSFLDRAADPDRRWMYKIGSDDPVGRESVAGPYLYDPADAGEEAAVLALEASGSNPFTREIGLVWSVPAAGDVRLTIFDVAGRRVRSLLTGTPAEKSGRVAWNGRDDGGRDLPAGLYWARLESAGRERTVRLALVR